MANNIHLYEWTSAHYENDLRTSPIKIIIKVLSISKKILASYEFVTSALSKEHV
jgi:hypothetical protein